MAATKLAAEIGNRIMELRVAHGWSQRDLARRAGLSTQSVIAFYELGERTPSCDTIIKLAEVFGVGVEYLLLGERPERPERDAVREARGGDTFIRIKAGTLTEAQIDAILALVASLTREKN